MLSTISLQEWSPALGVAWGPPKPKSAVKRRDPEGPGPGRGQGCEACVAYRTPAISVTEGNFLDWLGNEP